MARKTRRRRFFTRPPPSFSTRPEEEEGEEQGSFVDGDDDGEEDRNDPSSSFGSYGETNDDEGLDEKYTDGEYVVDDDTRAEGSSGPPSSASARTTVDFAPPAPSYINVAPLPVFRGLPDECPVVHLSRFSRVCRANNATSADMMARIFPATLHDEAGLWYELAVEPGDPSLSASWSETRSLFLEAYRRPEQYRSELMSIKQQETESVRSYHLRMRWILKKWPEHGFPDEILTVVFVDGLRGEERQDWIVLQGPDSLAEAYRLALSWERAESVRLERRKKEGSADGGGGSRCGFCDGEHEENGCEGRRKMRELWIRRSRNDEGVGVSRKEGDGTVVGDGGSKKPQCMCWKHQCWKKFDRSASAPVGRVAPPLPALAPDDKPTVAERNDGGGGDDGSLIAK